MQPLVTVYLTTYNRAHLLPRAIESVVAQEYRPLEILVVDDASVDSTESDISHYQEKLREIEGVYFRYLRQAKNCGACTARNKAIFSARGKFITGLDDDDEFLSNRIQGFVDAWDDRYAGLCTSLEIDHGNNEFSYLNKFVGEISFGELLDKNVVGSQIFTLTKRLKNIGGFDEEFPAWQDYECWIRLSKSYGVIKKIGQANYRVHISHDSPRITSDERSLKAISLLIKKHNQVFSKKQKKILHYKRLKAKGANYRRLSVWLPAMTWRTAPRILKRWLKNKFVQNT